MSTPASYGFREGIWDIRDYEIIAHYPEGDWRLTALDVESIRLEPVMDDGVPACDAFLRARSHPRSDFIGRFPQGEDQICVELALFAARNRIALIGQPLPVTTAGETSTNAETRMGTMVVTHAVPHRQPDMPKAPDSAFEVQLDPNETPEPNAFNQTDSWNQPDGFNQGTDPNQPYGFNQNTDANQPYGFNHADPNQPYGPGQNFDPHQGFNRSIFQEFSNPEWWRWTYDHANPFFRRNIVLTSLISVLLVGLLGALLIGGLRMGSFFSGPGFIILLIILSNKKKGKRRR